MSTTTETIRDYEQYNDDYYRYEEEKKTLRNKFPEKMDPDQFREFYSQLMELMRTSKNYERFLIYKRNITP
jgi:hypothetical protein